MKKLWDVTKQVNLFLVLNTIVWAVIGFAVWCIVRLAALDSIQWVICFMCYPAFFIGIVGGIIFLWNQN